jgi:hypothetical protein
VKTIDPNIKLDGFRLQQALESIYATFASVLLGRGAKDCPDLFLEEIPALVFGAAIGAGWLPLARPDTPIGTGKDEVVWEDDVRIDDSTLPQMIQAHLAARKAEGWEPPTPTRYSTNEAQRLVRFGEYMVDKVYMESFMVLLKDTIAFHLAEEPEHESNLKRLPKETSKAERETLLHEFVAKEEAKNGQITMKEIAERADVDYSVLVKWRNKQPPVDDDAVPAAQRIMCLLLFDEIGRARRYRRMPRK